MDSARSGLDATQVWLRLEGAAIFAGTAGYYFASGFDWLIFVALFLVPDLFMAGYLRGPRLGAFVYNLPHNYAGPVLLAALSLVDEFSGLLAFALIWAAHIGLDRLFGYGLKRNEGFKSTHLG